MELVKLKPAVKDYIWGGKTLKKWGKQSESESIAECWELSFNDAGPSLIDDGSKELKALKDVASKEDLGAKVTKFPFFPVLIKLIDSDSNLSVQVHPSDDYALKNEGQYGKTEMWHIIAHKKGAGIYLGFKRDTSEEELREALKSNTVEELLNFIPVEDGATYFIPSGTVHAIGGGVTLIEIQQNSTLTYRLYDYGRLGKDGKPRELHVDKAMKVINFKKFTPTTFGDGVLGKSDYFYVTEKDVNPGDTLIAKEDSFLSFTVISGEGKVNELSYKKGDTFFLPASKKARFDGSAHLVLTEVR